MKPRYVLLVLSLVLPRLVHAQAAAPVPPAAPAPAPAPVMTGNISTDELLRPPTPARIAFLVNQAGTQGWTGMVPALRQGAFIAYEAKRGSAPAWYYLYRWADLLSLTETQALTQWAHAVDDARVGHPNMKPAPPDPNRVLASHWSRELHLFALGSYAFSEEFFATLQSVDNPVEVLNILQRLYALNPARFAEYQNLAIAIAVVYDVPPPPSWPHGQVSAEALPRKLPAPDVAFRYWTDLDRAGATLQRLRFLPAGELKFVVDEIAPFSDLDWARKNIPVGLPDLAKTYDLIHYRKDRLDANDYMWSLPDYHLTTILQNGGICVDQAYFASVSGKAKGTPTLLFLGKGLDGRHAWFGYLDGQQKWQLDCGRYAEQQLDVGVAYDPQTWRTITDFELRFLTDRFRNLPTYRLSLTDAEFSGEYLKDGKVTQALRAARDSVNRERRNLNGWTALLQAENTATKDPRVIEGVLREAILAYQKYPDLNLLFTQQLANSMRARGETSAAKVEEKHVAKVYQAQSSQGMVAIEQAINIMERTIQEDQLPQQVHNYQVVLDTYGRGAGYDFFDRVVVPFANYLQTQHQVPSALSAIDRARKYLRVDKGGQLDDAMNELSERLKSSEN